MGQRLHLNVQSKGKSHLFGGDLSLGRVDWVLEAIGIQLSGDDCSTAARGVDAAACVRMQQMRDTYFAKLDSSETFSEDYDRYLLVDTVNDLFKIAALAIDLGGEVSFYFV